MNCINSHKDYFSINYFNTFYADSMSFSETKDHFASVILCNSSSVIISNMNIKVTVNKSYVAILIVNVKGTSEIIDVEVQVNSSNCTAFSRHPTEVSGLKILVYFYDKVSKSGLLTTDNL